MTVFRVEILTPHTHTHTIPRLRSHPRHPEIWAIFRGEEHAVGRVCLWNTEI